jgi:hypothetical protein
VQRRASLSASCSLSITTELHHRQSAATSGRVVLQTGDCRAGSGSVGPHASGSAGLSDADSVAVGKAALCSPARAAMNSGGAMVVKLGAQWRRKQTLSVLWWPAWRSGVGRTHQDSGPTGQGGRGDWRRPVPPMGRRRHPTRRLACGPHAKGFLYFKINSKIIFLCKKNS